MSDWKSISKGSYDFGTIGKLSMPQSPDPMHRFKVKGNKVRYSEGDEITTAAYPVFNVEFTGNPIDNNHWPCGYWHRNYVPPYWYVYTSRVYPVEIVDSIISDVTMVEGIFRSILLFYDNGIDSITSSNVSLIEGVFRSSLLTYSYAESINSTNITLQSGVFKDVLLSYDIGIESITSSNVVLSSAVFRDALIEYSEAEFESVTTSNISLISGTYGS